MRVGANEFVPLRSSSATFVEETSPLETTARSTRASSGGKDLLHDEDPAFSFVTAPLARVISPASLRILAGLEVADRGNDASSTAKVFASARASSQFAEHARAVVGALQELLAVLDFSSGAWRGRAENGPAVMSLLLQSVKSLELAMLISKEASVRQLFALVLGGIGSALLQIEGHSDAALEFCRWVLSRLVDPDEHLQTALESVYKGGESALEMVLHPALPPDVITLYILVLNRFLFQGPVAAVPTSILTPTLLTLKALLPCLSALALSTVKFVATDSIVASVVVVREISIAWPQPFAVHFREFAEHFSALLRSDRSFLSQDAVLIVGRTLRDLQSFWMSDGGLFGSTLVLQLRTQLKTGVESLKKFILQIEDLVPISQVAGNSPGNFRRARAVVTPQVSLVERSLWNQLPNVATALAAVVRSIDREFPMPQGSSTGESVSLVPVFAADMLEEISQAWHAALRMSVSREAFDFDPSSTPGAGGLLPVDDSRGSRNSRGGKKFGNGQTILFPAKTLFVDDWSGPLETLSSTLVALLEVFSASATALPDPFFRVQEGGIHASPARRLAALLASLLSLPVLFSALPSDSQERVSSVFLASAKCRTAVLRSLTRCTTAPSNEKEQYLLEFNPAMLVSQEQSGVSSLAFHPDFDEMWRTFASVELQVFRAGDPAKFAFPTWNFFTSALQAEDSLSPRLLPISLQAAVAASTSWRSSVRGLLPRANAEAMVLLLTRFLDAVAMHLDSGHNSEVKEICSVAPAVREIGDFVFSLTSGVPSSALWTSGSGFVSAELRCLSRAVSLAPAATVKSACLAWAGERLHSIPGGSLAEEFSEILRILVRMSSDSDPSIRLSSLRVMLEDQGQVRRLHLSQADAEKLAVRLSDTNSEVRESALQVFRRIAADSLGLNLPSKFGFETSGYNARNFSRLVGWLGNESAVSSETHLIDIATPRDWFARNGDAREMQGWLSQLLSPSALSVGRSSFAGHVMDAAAFASFFAVSARLRTHFGAAAQTFDGLFALVRSLLEEVQQQRLDDQSLILEAESFQDPSSHPRVTNFAVQATLHLYFCLERAIAVVSGAKRELPKHLSDTSTFFHANRDVCAGYFDRASSSLIALSRYGGGPAQSVLFGWRRLQYLQRRATSILERLRIETKEAVASGDLTRLSALVSDTELAAAQTVSALCRIGDGAAVDGLIRWLSRVFVRPFSSLKFRIRQKRESMFQKCWVPFGHSFLWAKGVVCFARGEYERCATLHADALANSFCTPPFALEEFEENDVLCDIEELLYPVAAVKLVVQQIVDSLISTGSWVTLSKFIGTQLSSYRSDFPSHQGMRSALTPSTGLGFLREGLFNPSARELATRYFGALAYFDDGSPQLASALLEDFPRLSANASYSSTLSAPLVGDWRLYHVLLDRQTSRSLPCDFTDLAQSLLPAIVSAHSAGDKNSFASLHSQLSAISAAEGTKIELSGVESLHDLMRFKRVEAAKHFAGSGDTTAFFDISIKLARHARHHRNTELAKAVLSKFEESPRREYEQAKVFHAGENGSVAMSQACRALELSLKSASATPNDRLMSVTIALRIGRWLTSKSMRSPTHAMQVTIPPAMRTVNFVRSDAIYPFFSGDGTSVTPETLAVELLSFAATAEIGSALDLRSARIRAQAEVRLAELHAEFALPLSESEVRLHCWEHTADVSELASGLEALQTDSALQTDDGISTFSLEIAEKLYANVLAQPAISAWNAQALMRDIPMDMLHAFGTLESVTNVIRAFWEKRTERAERAGEVAFHHWGRALTLAGNLPNSSPEAIALRMLGLLLNNPSSQRIGAGFSAALEGPDSNFIVGAFSSLVPQLISRASASSDSRGVVEVALRNLLVRLARVLPHAVVFPAIFRDDKSNAVVQALQSAHDSILRNAQLFRREMVEIARLPAEQWAVAVARCESEVRARTQRLIERWRDSGNEDDVAEFVHDYVEDVLSPSIAPLVSLQRATLGLAENPHSRWFALTYSALTGSCVSSLRELAADSDRVVDSVLDENDAFKAETWRLAAGTGRRADGSIASPTELARALVADDLWTPLRTLSREFARFTHAPVALVGMTADNSDLEDNREDMEAAPTGDQRSEWSLRALQRTLAGTKFEIGDFLLPGLHSSSFSGSAATADTEACSVHLVLDRISVLPTKTHPRQLTLESHAGRHHRYLLKGGEDLRLDERIAQILSFVNRSLRTSEASVGYRKRHRREKHARLTVGTYAVVPFNPTVGLIQWVDDTVSLFDLYKSRVRVARRDASGADESSLSLRPTELFYAHLAPALRAANIPNAPTTSQECASLCANLAERRRWPSNAFRTAFRSLSKEVQRLGLTNFVSTEMWARAGSALSAYSVQHEFAASLAVMSTVGYFVGLGDRHLDNILITGRSGVSSSAQALAIDFNICFEKGRRLRIPELVPFRLTQSMRAGLGVLETEGVFKRAMTLTIGGLRKPQVFRNLRTLLSSFETEPLRSWELDYAAAMAGVSSEYLQQVLRNLGRDAAEAAAYSESRLFEPEFSELSDLTTDCRRVMHTVLPQSISKLIAFSRKARRLCTKTDSDFGILVSVCAEERSDEAAAPVTGTNESALRDFLRRKDKCETELVQLREECERRTLEQGQFQHDMLNNVGDEGSDSAFGRSISPASLDDSLRSLLDPRVRKRDGYIPGDTLGFCVSLCEHPRSSPGLVFSVPALLFTSLETEMDRSVADVDTCFHSIVRDLEDSVDLLREAVHRSTPEKFTIASAWLARIDSALQNATHAHVFALVKEQDSLVERRRRMSKSGVQQKRVQQRVVESSRSGGAAITALEGFLKAALSDLSETRAAAAAAGSNLEQKLEQLTAGSDSLALEHVAIRGTISDHCALLISDLRAIDRADVVAQAMLLTRARVIASIVVGRQLLEGQSDPANDVSSLCGTVFALPDLLADWAEHATDEATGSEDAWQAIWVPVCAILSWSPTTNSFNTVEAIAKCRSRLSRVLGFEGESKSVSDPSAIRSLVADATIRNILEDFYPAFCDVAVFALERLQVALHSVLFSSHGSTGTVWGGMLSLFETAVSTQRAQQRASEASFKHTLISNLLASIREDAGIPSADSFEISDSLKRRASRIASLAEELRSNRRRLSECNNQFESNEDATLSERQRTLRSFTERLRTDADRNAADEFASNTEELRERSEDRRDWHADCSSMINLVLDVADTASEVLFAYGVHLVGDETGFQSSSLERSGIALLREYSAALEGVEAVEGVSRVQDGLRDHFAAVRSAAGEALTLAKRMDESSFCKLEAVGGGAALESPARGAGGMSQGEDGLAWARLSTFSGQAARLCGYTDGTASVFENARRVSSLRAKVERAVLSQPGRTESSICRTLASLLRSQSEDALALLRSPDGAASPSGNGAKEAEASCEVASSGTPSEGQHAADGLMQVMGLSAKQQQQRAQLLHSRADTALRACTKTLEEAHTAIEALGSAISALSRSCKLVAEGGERQSAGLVVNGHGQAVLERVLQKVEGREFGSAPLSAEKHADRLIREATSETNLALTYEGWTAWI